MLSGILAGQPSPLPTVRFASGDVVELARLLREEGLHHLYIDGGSVARGFIAAGLCDTIIVSIVPTIVGGGPRLFDDDPEVTMPRSNWRLSWSERYPSGLMQLCYMREG